jgi:hypothetical protein
MLYRNGTAVGSKTPAQARTWLSLVVGTNVQAWDADLDGLAALGNGIPIRSGGTWAVGTISAPLSLSGSTLSVGAASTSAAGVVELANDGEETAGLAVQASDSRLAAAPSLWSVWGHVQPRGTISPPSYDGRGALSAAGIHSVSVAEPNFPAFRLGDTSANACRFTIVGAFRLDEGSWTIDYVFKLGSDISATQSCWIGMFNGTTLDSADPSTSHRVGLRYTAGTDTNWMLGTKDGTTPNNVDSGVAVTASYYYVVRLRLTTTTYTAQIGRGVTLAAAVLDFASFAPVANNSNLTGSTTDLQIISSCYRASVASANRSIISGPMLWRCDL